MTAATAHPRIDETPSRAPRATQHPAARLLIATINRPQGDTGVHTHTRMLRAGLAAAGAQCDVISPFDGSKKWYPIFAVRPLLLNRVNRTWSTRWHRRFHADALREVLQQRLAHEPVDAVIAQCPVSARAALDVRAQLNQTFTVALVCHFNGSEAQEYRDKGELNDDASFRAMLEFEDRVLREVDRVIYVSHWARQSVESTRAITPKASHVVWNGLAATGSREGGGARVAGLTRDDLKLSQDDLILINVGSLEQRKNQLGLIGLFAKIRATHANAKLVLVGDGVQCAQIERKITDFNLRNDVKLLGMRHDVPELLALADVYLHYATLENCPIVLLEAARAGLPFAAIAAGGIPELQAKLECEVSLDPNDHEKSLAALQPLLASADDRKERGARARASFHQHFTQEAMARAYLDALSGGEKND